MTFCTQIPKNIPTTAPTPALAPLAHGLVYKDVESVNFSSDPTYLTFQFGDHSPVRAEVAWMSTQKDTSALVLEGVYK